MSLPTPFNKIRMASRLRSFCTKLQLKATKLIHDEKALRILTAEAEAKFNASCLDPDEHHWEVLHVILRLVKAWNRGAYQWIEAEALEMAIAALLYFTLDGDLVPDHRMGGLLDDAAMTLIIADIIDRHLDDFVLWESEALAYAN